MLASSFLLCSLCVEVEAAEANKTLEWRQRSKETPLRLFDPFAGCGAFVLGLCELGNMEFTHATEICPSTAATLR